MAARRVWRKLGKVPSKNQANFIRAVKQQTWRAASVDATAVDSDAVDDDERSEEPLLSNEGFKLYPNHIPTTALQKGLLAVGSAFMGLYDPTRQDMIAALGETTGYPALQKMHSRMINDSVGQEILRLKPRITGATAPIKELRKLPDGTLGREYARFMENNKISADTRTPVKFVDDKELAYVIQRYRDVHDFVHTLSGIPTVSVAGEIAVKWFEMVHFGLPMCALASFFGPLNTNVTFKQRQDLVWHYIPWAVNSALNANFVLNVFFERRFEDPLDEIRQELNLITAPKVEG